MPSDAIVIVGALVVLMVVYLVVGVCAWLVHRDNARIDRLINANRATRRANRP